MAIVQNVQSFNVSRKSWIVLAALVITAGLLRFMFLDTLPVGLFRDEAEKGYTALELWRTGRQGVFTPQGVVPTRFLPIILDAGGVKTSAIYQYLSAPVVGMFGLSVFTTRFVAALCGTLTVLATFFLARRIASGGHTALWSRKPSTAPPHEQTLFAIAAMLFAAVSPNHILFSRWAQQGITVPLWFCAAMIMLLRVPTTHPRHQRAVAALGGMFAALAFYSYAPMRLVVPLALLGLWAEMGRDIRRLAKLYWPAAVLFFAAAIPLLVFATGEGAGRFTRISVFADQSFGEAILNAAQNYLAHFNPRYLFFHGDKNPRHGMPLAGNIAWAEVPFFLLGIITIFQWHRPGSRLLLFWFLSAPAAAALTNEGVPHTLRSILFFPVVHLVSARGAELIARLLARKLSGTRAAAAATSAFIIASLITIALNIYAMRVLMPRDAIAWQHGVLEALEVMREQNPGGPNVLSAEVPYAHYYILFHEQTSPELFHELGGAALRTMVLLPGSPLPENALVARPPQIFERTEGLYIPHPDESESNTAVMTIRAEW